MAHRSRESVSLEVQSEQKELMLAEGLAFRGLLSEKKVLDALEKYGVEFRERVYTPMVTLFAFLSQVIAGKDSSCEDAVSRVAADRAARGEKVPSPDTSSYCQSRLRLPEPVVSQLARETGQEAHREAPAEWLWKGRRVVIVDGSTATMADTPANQEAFPQSSTQKAGLGFPILRLVVLLSLATGTVLECAISSCRGKKTGEQSLFRQMWDVLQPGEILLGDCLYDAYCDIAKLRERGTDAVFGKKQSRRCDFRRGRKLGHDDHIVVWKKPRYNASRYESREAWEALPDEMEMRETRLTIRRKGFRPRTIIIVTTLLDAKAYSAKDLTDLFAERWHCELDLRSIKQTLGMYHLNCKSPSMVRKELWTHLLAYNLIRTRMTRAAEAHGEIPRRLSFSGAAKLIHYFAQHLSNVNDQEYERLEAELLKAIARRKIPHRPGRKEPRAIKKRKQKYSYLTEPRLQARQRLAA